jgi:hypothetical protein
MKRLLLFFAVFLLCAHTVFAQSLAMDIVTDPTTYIPMATFYIGEQLDWNSSQAHFARGEIEVNPRFTRSGRPYSTPLSYGDGNRLILRDTLQTGALSVANNLVMRLIERRVAAGSEHHTAWKRLSRVERVAVASALAFGLSSAHFEQWRSNTRPLR